jgi:hypothetical protein
MDSRRPLDREQAGGQRGCPFEPPETTASARPSATARHAWTTEASGLRRTARAGPDLGRSTAARRRRGTPSGTAPSSARGRTAGSGDRRGPPRRRRGRSRRYRRRPRLASTATVSTTLPRRGRSVSVIVVVRAGVRRDDGAATVGPAVGAHAVRPAGLVALRALVDRLRRQLVLRAALVVRECDCFCLGTAMADGRVADRYSNLISDSFAQRLSGSAAWAWPGSSLRLAPHCGHRPGAVRPAGDLRRHGERQRVPRPGAQSSSPSVM